MNHDIFQCDTIQIQYSLRGVGFTLRPGSPTGWKRSRWPAFSRCKRDERSELCYMRSSDLIQKYLICLLSGLLGLCFACSSHATAPQKAPTALEMARENLRISQATEKRIASELQQLKQSGNASEEVIKDYEIYLERVQAMVAENQKIVRDMEAAWARHSPPKKETGSTFSNELDNMLDPQIPEQQTVDELAALDKELDASLSEFDEMLLKELELIRSKSADKMRDLAEEAAEAAKRLKEKGVDLGSSSSQASSESEADAEKDTSDQQNQQEQKEGAGDDQTAESDTSRESGEGAARKQDRHGSGEDDDIVARQLREAAEKETDPELKEKLWKEYEEYKENTGN